MQVVAKDRLRRGVEIPATPLVMAKLNNQPTKPSGLELVKNVKSVSASHITRPTLLILFIVA